MQCAIDYDKMLGPLYEKSDKDKIGLHDLWIPLAQQLIMRRGQVW